MTDCKILIKLFAEYVGGKLICDYDIISDINKEECKFEKIKESEYKK